jgi:hypothetical protein
VSTSGVYSEDNGDFVNESSARSAEAYPEVIAAEDWALEQGAHVVRMAGLYDLTKGPHIYWARKTQAPTRGKGWINLIHRSDAAAALCEVLTSQLSPGVWNVSDGQPVRRFEVAEAWARHTQSKPVEFSDQEGGFGKRLNTEAFRTEFFFVPRWSSFLDFVDSLERPRSVLGRKLQDCCRDPVTGYFRDGLCRTDESDQGTHIVCAQVTREFLDFSLERGNDLSTPRPDFQFPGLKPGDCWCLCASRWVEALVAGVAPKIYLERTHESMLEWVDLSVLRSFAVDAFVDQN